MTLYYSASKSGFFDSSIHRTIPSDAVLINNSDYESLISGQAQGCIIVSNSDGHPVLSKRPIADISSRRHRAKVNIDEVAGAARAGHVSAGYMVAEEYRQAEDSVKEWRASGSPPSDTPVDIQVWAEAAGITAEQAATNIEQTAAAWRQVISSIRDIRLKGKSAVDNAEDENRPDDMAEVAQPFIDQLNAIAVPES